MANNLFISYDLSYPGQHYERVAEAIKKMGAWAKVQKSCWYVNSPYSAEYVAKQVWASMDSNDNLIVVDASNNDAYWYNLDPQVSSHLQAQWRL
ncbi:MULTISPECIES: hypothetical protein [Pseudomonas]|uniref:hypothetical protein n=1 Tax=Pseudomonas TaxID=286 RepID=UPI0009FAC770|nr:MULTISPECIES: hypothetical protein [Pseudomonas]MBI7027849.1 hypothetical protein [Pseudomonas aeruginosa]MBI9170382.1 hypothetical protein [Pseudomonas aeruginosa]MCD2820912.1 hypothetical protein [Pseudomonas aeruginosa]MCD2829465.1 hypothetical protein [Pseudomonas aeruginosa]MCO4018687.1 hypothetical protein [Pseudomonas aeruginosa]